MREGRWEFCIDRGGTFTDCLGRNPETGRVHVAKVLSSDRAPLVGIRQILALAEGDAIPACDIRMGTTIATNALLERKGVPCGLVMTRGFGDLLEIGTQARPHIFDLDIQKPGVLYSEVLEVDARAAADGSIVARPDPATLRIGLRGMRERGLRSVAICVLHAYAAPELEREIAAIAREEGFEHTATSSEVAAEIGLLARGDTACVDAYLTPLIRDYVGGLLAELPGSSLRIMQSSGGLTDAQRFRGPHAILSGPAGGVVAYARVARSMGESRAIGFDMGGTSTDVSRFDGEEFERVYESETAGVRIRAPMMAIHTVAAGGGSLCRYDGFRFTVGPESAGAVPGPLCYGHPEATELTVTDINLALGRVVGDRFPFPLETTRVEAALNAIVARLADQGLVRSRDEVAAGFLEIANANMAEAIRQISVARGYDVRDYALVVFGGAGGQHACALARRLGIRKVCVHPYAGVLSAYGMGLADVAWHGEAELGRLAPEEDFESRFARLEDEGRKVLADEGFLPERVACFRRLDLRYAGTETALTLPEGDNDRRAAFEALHTQRFGYARPGHPVEAVVARVEVLGRHREVPEVEEAVAGAGAPEPVRHTRLWSGDAFHEDVPVYLRETIGGGRRVEGPALILEGTATLVVDAGFSVDCDPFGRLLLRDGGDREAVCIDTGIDPVQLEIFNNLFMSIAEQMGTVLRRTALSTNIRERLDFSCAIFDTEGGLVANAPHIPVHLGAMGESVRAVRADHPDPVPGDVYVTNDPAGGGSHLPDITVVTPVHGADGVLWFYAASRGHHADVGGITPGSMPPFSTTLEEEGVVLRGLRIVRDGVIDEDTIRRALAGATYPARNPRDNLADLEAQIAANATGVRLLAEMVERYGLATVRAYMGHVQDNAAALVAAEIAKLEDGEHHFEDALDDGTPIAVTLRVRGDHMAVDFAGTGPELARGNLNAPRAVTIAAVIYVLRALVGEPIPLNAGCLRPVEIDIPPGSVLSPGAERAVCGGNVETSQRVVDVLLGALGRLAACQGTMNNLTFGNDRFGYYETIGGGAGGGPGSGGASGVHTHMTNTRITDPEVLESRFPVRLIRFELRAHSGGAGAFPGGDGLVREIEFNEPMKVSILSERRARSPFGLAGGAPGSRGRNLHNDRDVGARCVLDVVSGDRITIETPGGGGYGAADGCDEPASHLADKRL